VATQASRPALRPWPVGWWLVSALLAALAVQAALTWPLVRAFIDDLALIRTFGGDETGLVETVLGMLSRGSPDPGIYKYGALYFQVPWALLSLAGLWGRVGAHETALVLRLVSLAGALGVIAALAHLSRRLFGPTAALAALGLSSGLPVLVRWGGFSHPDTWALLSLTLALGLLARGLREERLKDLAWAGLWAGLAAGLKLSGLFVLPFVVLGAAWLGWRRPEQPFSRPSLALSLGLALAAGLALAGLTLRRLADPATLAQAAGLAAEETGRPDLVPWWLGRLPELSLGLLLLAGLLALGLILARAFGRLERWPGLSAGLGLVAAALLCFLAGLLISHNLAPFHPRAWAAAVLTESVRLQHGWVRPAWFWWRLLARPEFWGSYALLLSLAGLAWGLVRPSRAGERLAVGLLGGWLIFMLLYLSAGVTAPFPRHGLSLIPALALLAALAAGRAGGLTGRPWLGRGLALALVLPVLITNIGAGLQAAQALEVKRQSPNLAVGRWLARNYPARASVQHDPYVYVPEVFQDKIEDWDPSLAEVEARRPRLIVTNEGFSRRFFEITLAGKFRPQDRDRARRFYEALRDDGLGGRYRRVKTLDGITVWERIGP